VNLRFLDLLAVEKRKSVLEIILTEITGKWIFTMLSVWIFQEELIETWKGQVSIHILYCGENSWRRHAKGSGQCLPWGVFVPLWISVQKGNLNHGMIVFLLKIRLSWVSNTTPEWGWNPSQKTGMWEIVWQVTNAFKGWGPWDGIRSLG
jgi:hypothetical protein